MTERPIATILIKLDVDGVLTTSVNTKIYRADGAEYDELVAAHSSGDAVTRDAENFHVTRFSGVAGQGFFTLDATTDTPSGGGGGGGGGGGSGGGGGGGGGGGSTAPQDPAFLLGVNLMPNADWSTHYPFSNLLMQMRSPFSGVRFGTWSDGRAFTCNELVDANGNFTGLEFPSVLSGQAIRIIPSAAPRPSNQIRISYTGTRPDVTGTLVSESAGQIIVTSPTSSSDAFRIDVIGPCTITECTLLGTDAFVSVMANFAGLRFMDFQNTNASRTTNILHDVQRKIRIAALDTDSTTVATCESVATKAPAGSARWFCVPAGLPDNDLPAYVQGIIDAVDPTCVVYIEHSNEVWNSQFPQSRQFSATFDTNQRWHARRSARIAGIIEGLLATPAYANRTVHSVLGAWSDSGGGVFWQSELIQECAAYVSANPTLGAMPDTLSTAPYFGHSLPDDVAIFTDGRLTSAINSALAEIDQARAIATANGMRLVCYEGGQHITNNGGMTVNRDSRMEAALLTYLRGVRTRCDGMFFYALSNLYTSSGSWGLMETVHTPDTPKMRAMITFASEI